MDLIKPAEISSKIMTLIDEVDEKLIIVSPYNNLKKWPKLQRRLEYAVEKDIYIEYYVRAGEKQKGLKEIGISPIEVNNLHAKLYINEKNAIVTSLNLLKYSDSYSLDIGYFIDGKKELKDLMEFFHRYISIYNIEKKR